MINWGESLVKKRLLFSDGGNINNFDSIYIRPTEINNIIGD